MLIDGGVATRWHGAEPKPGNLAYLRAGSGDAPLTSPDGRRARTSC